jgi:hypothetical protein
MPFTETDLREVLAERSRDAPLGTDFPAAARRRGRLIRLLRRLLGAGFAAGAIATIALLPLGPRDPVPADPGPGTRPERVDVSVFRGRMTSEIHAATPADLAGRSDAVVVGTYEGFTPGRMVTYQQGARRPLGVAMRPMVMRVRVDRKIAGADRYVAGGRVYIAFCCSAGSTEVPRYRAAVPPGTRLIAFLYDRTAGRAGPGGWLVPGPEGHPPGTMVMEPHPQGLIFEEPAAAGGGRLVGGLADLRRSGPAWNRTTTLDAFAEQLRG